MPFLIALQPLVNVVEPGCAGGYDATLSLQLSGGVPPYQFQIVSGSGGFSTTGSIPSDGIWMEAATGLAAGWYDVQVTDAFFDTSFSVQIGEPDPIDLTDLFVHDATCFGFCDGALDVTIQGGTGLLSFAWSNGGNSPALDNLCAGEYTLSVTDGNACSATFDLAVASPEAFLVDALVLRAVSCFGGNDGVLAATANDSPIFSVWSNGQTGDTLAGLPQGIYSVTVTNADGCTGTGQVVLPAPQLPVTADAELLSPVICHGEASGAVVGTAAGPDGPFTFLWENGSTDSSRSGLTAGVYVLTVSNTLGCTATLSVEVPQPDSLFAFASSNTVTCFDPPDAGVVHVDQVNGGWPPFRFSRDGLSFSDDPVLSGYTVGVQSYFVQDAFGCIRSFQAVVEGTLDVEVDAGPPIQLDLGEEAQLAVLVNQADLSIAWDPTDFLSCSDCMDPVVRPTRDIVYAITATDDFGCSARTSLTISVMNRRRLFIPNVFSPNGDGINDTLKPFPGKEVDAILRFDIFDRQGNQVFHLANDLDNATGTNWWDGRFRGKELPAGVYTWVGRLLFINGKQEIIRGEVTLLR
jgi:gliding motility-associated-like protein